MYRVNYGYAVQLRNTPRYTLYENKEKYRLIEVLRNQVNYTNKLSGHVNNVKLRPTIKQQRKGPEICKNIH